MTWPVGFEPIDHAKAADKPFVDLDDSDYEIEELIESEVTLDSWLDPSGRIDKVALYVPNVDVCSNTPSEDLQPYSSEYEGYMGNWGNTLDRWYHRGAVVLWPKDLSFATRAEASAAHAVDTLARQVRSGDLDGARREAATVVPFWERTVNRTEGNGLVGKALQAATALDDPDVAAMLLHPFHLEQIHATDAKALSALVERYGEA